MSDEPTQSNYHKGLKNTGHFLWDNILTNCLSDVKCCTVKEVGKCLKNLGKRSSV